MEAKPERLQKILAASGIASRRKAEELIAAGLVSVNGHTVTEPGTKADPRLDEIRVDGKLLRGPERHVYLAIYKPKGHMTTVSDPEGRPTVMDLLKGVEERVFPVGRLDYMSEGLLLLTNDGDLMAQLTRAGAHLAKTYMVKVSGMPTEEALDKLRNGIMLPPEPGLTGARGKKQPGVERRSFAVLTQPAVIQLAVDQENPWFEVTLTEGRNRQLRRMFEQVGHHIEKIKRVRYGSLTLDLEPGEFRHLTPKEVTQLRKSLDTPFKPKPLKVKRKDERPERKPRVDTARFVKGRRGKPSANAPTTAPTVIARRTSAGSTYGKSAISTRTASASSTRGATPPPRDFAPREDRGERSSFSRPRGPEFGQGERREAGFAATRGDTRKYTRKPAGELGAKSSTDFKERPKRPYTSKPAGAFDRKPGSFDRKPAGDFARREGASTRRPTAKREGGFSEAPPKRTTSSIGGFGFDKFAKPKFVKPSKHRDLGSDKTAGFTEHKPFGDRPYSKERGPGSDRGFAGKSGGFSAGRKYSSKGPGKPAGSETRTGSDFKPASGFKRTGESRPAGRGSDFGKGFGAKRTGSAPPRSGGGADFKRAGGFKRPAGGATRRPSSPARGGSASRPPRRRNDK
jgi:23S rRNA pseudouridine2605 synthase